MFLFSQRMVILLLSLILFSCTNSRLYTYSINLENPIQSNKLYFENDTMSVSFTFLPKSINFDVYNKSEDGIRINWDELSMSVNGEAKRVVHKETGAYKITETQPPTTIPPKTTLSDGIVPTDNIKYLIGKYSTYPSTSDLYPISDYGKKKIRESILKKKGQRVTIFFPYYIRNVFQSKTFNFIITDIQEKKGRTKG